MRIELHIFVNDSVNDYSALGRRFRFAVVDLDRSGEYPRNFVCILPLQISDKPKSKTAFNQIFGDKSVEQAKALFKKALKTGENSDVKAEIKRRLDLLEPERIKQVTCSECGRLFHPRRVRKFSRNFCEECLRKKFAGRD